MTGSIIFLGIVIFLLIYDDQKERVLANGWLLLYGWMAVSLFGGIYWLTEKRTAVRKWKNHPLPWLSFAYLLLFAVQIFLVNRTYFYTGWDVSLLQFRVNGLLEGKSMAEVSADVGYSIYPNNLLLFYVFYLMEKAAQLVGMANPYHMCIYFSCLSVNAACFLGNLVIRRLTDKPLIRGAYTVISTLYILLSPWIMIPYSDTYGMFFVMLGIWALVCVDKVWIKWPVAAFVGMIGYYVKPTCIFPLFGAYLIFGTWYVVRLKKDWKKLCILIGSTVIFWLAGLCIPIWVQHTFSFRLIKEMEIPYTHYLMMGLNPSTNGGYNHDDFLYSSAFPDVESRKQGNREEIQRRLEAYTPEAFGEFLKEKALINFNDGSFAWALEGGFFTGYVEHDNIFADIFRQVFIPPYVYENNGDCYYGFKTVSQAVWLMILLGIVGNLFAYKEKSLEKACMMIPLCGLLLFVMLFEARARYLYLYSPVFLVLAINGWQAVYDRVIAIYSTSGYSLHNRR